MKARIATLVALTLMTAGCALTPPPVVHPSIQETAPGTTGSPAPAAVVSPSPMPMPDGSAMLWPITSSHITPDAVTPDTDYWTRYGFIDASAHVIRPEQYLAYTYCMDSSGKPTRIAALNQNQSTDLFDLDGTLARTIPAQKNHDPYDGVLCPNNKEIWVFSDGEGQITSGVAYQADTGKKIRSLDGTIISTSSCSDTAKKATAKLPAGYLTWISDEWAVDTKSDTPAGEINDGAISATKAINVTTSAVVPLDDDNMTYASGPYLVVIRTKNLTEVYGRDGTLTPFGSLTSAHDLIDDCGTSGFQAPYYWVTSGRLQGYVDEDGAWYYQESADQTLAND